LTDWEGWDPETGQGVSSLQPFPVMKSYAVGLELSF
jgi:TonB-dependent starch-binding outer membrane protein SusC